MSQLVSDLVFIFDEKRDKTMLLEVDENSSLFDIRNSIFSIQYCLSPLALSPSLLAIGVWRLVRMWKTPNGFGKKLTATGSGIRGFYPIRL